MRIACELVVFCSCNIRKGIASEMGAIGMYITRRGIELREKNRGKKLGEEVVKWLRQMANRFAVLTALFR